MPLSSSEHFWRVFFSEASSGGLEPCTWRLVVGTRIMFFSRFWFAKLSCNGRFPGQLGPILFPYFKGFWNRSSMGIGSPTVLVGFMEKISLSNWFG